MEIVNTRKAVVLPTALVLLITLVIAITLGLGSKPARHSVRLTWHAPVPANGVTVAGYNVYWSIASGGPYIRIAHHVTGPSYRDTRKQ